jgi:hypothetical protein
MAAAPSDRLQRRDQRKQVLLLASSMHRQQMAGALEEIDLRVGGALIQLNRARLLLSSPIGRTGLAMLGPAVAMLWLRRRPLASDHGGSSFSGSRRLQMAWQVLQWLLLWRIGRSPSDRP